MSIQSGALAIISKVKEVLRPIFLSIRLYIVLVCMLAGMIPLAVCGKVALENCRKQIIESRCKDAKYTASIFADRLSSDTSIEASITTSLKDEIEQAADIYKSRFVIVDSYFEIVLDTFRINFGSTCISSEVVKALSSGNAMEHFDSVSEQMEFIIPILKKEELSLEAEEKREVIGAIVVSMSTESLTNLLTNVQNRLLVVDLVVFLVLFVISVQFSKICVHPLDSLRKKLESVTEGNLDTNLTSNSYTEINQVTDALNEVLEQLRKVEQSRQEFVSNVSHELKTPITSVRVLADSIMLVEDVPVEMYREFLGDISEEIDREARIIDDLLTMVRMDKSGMKLEIKKLNLNELIESVMKRIRPIAKRRDIEMKFESKRMVFVEIDETKFSLALTNLIENAVKYNNVGGWVLVSLDADYKYCYIKIEDNGVGVPDDAKAHLFERFYRVDKARSRETGGTGLGLAITKDIVLMHHGAIRLDSELGKGSTFTVRLPLKYIV